MPTAELLNAWKPRPEGPYSYELTTALTAEIEALGFPHAVASYAAGSVVNFQCERDFGLLGTHHSDTWLASKALTAVEAWLAAKAPAQVRKAA